MIIEIPLKVARLYNARHYETKHLSVSVDDNSETEYNFVIIQTYALRQKGLLHFREDAI